MSLSDELRDCIDLFVQGKYSSSMPKQKEMLLNVLMSMGVTDMDELSDVDRECMGTVGDKLQLSPIARNTMRLFFVSFGSTLSPSGSSSVDSTLPLHLEMAEVANDTVIPYNASQEMLGDHNQGSTSLRAPCLQDYSWSAYDKMNKDLCEGLLRQARDGQSWLKEHDALVAAEDLEIEREVYQRIRDTPMAPLSGSNVGTAAFEVARLSGNVWESRYSLLPRHGLHNLDRKACRLVSSFLFVPDPNSLFGDVECIYVESDDSDDPEDGSSGGHRINDGPTSARSSPTARSVLSSSRTALTGTGSSSKTFNARELPLVDIGIEKKVNTDAPGVFGKCSSAASSDDIVIKTVTPCNSTTPTLHSRAPNRTGQYTCALTVDLTAALESVFGTSPSRVYCSSRAYADAEWKVVEDFLFIKFRESSIFDCFWSWRRKRAIPVMKGAGKQWNQSATFPPECLKSLKDPNGQWIVRNWWDHTGFEYHCDHEVQTSCPRKCRVFRDWTNPLSHTFNIWLDDSEPRHGCTHTLSPNAKDSNNAVQSTPALHASIKVYIQNAVLAANAAITWSRVRAGAESMALESLHLHCRQGHMPDDFDRNNPKLQGLATCKHRATYIAFANSFAMARGNGPCILGSLPPTENFTFPNKDPPYARYLATVKGKDRSYNRYLATVKEKDTFFFKRFIDTWQSVKGLLLTNGGAMMGTRLFHPVINKQAVRYVARWNRTLYGCPATETDQSSMWKLFEKENLFSLVTASTCFTDDEGALPMNLWKWCFIGMLYEEDIQGGSKTTTVDEPEQKLFHFAAMYASVSSLLWYLVSIRKAGLVGWQNSLMDVVHEIGSDVRNLNLFNMGVSDAKQTCAHTTVVIHYGRRGYVYEATSACLHAAATFVWRHSRQISEHCLTYGYDLSAHFGLTDDFFPPASTSFSTAVVPSVLHIPIEHDLAITTDGNIIPHKRKGVTVRVRVAFPRPQRDDADYVPTFPPGHVYLGSVTDGEFTMWRRWILQLPRSFRRQLDMDSVARSGGVRFCDRHKGVLLKRDGEQQFKMAVEKRSSFGNSSHQPMSRKKAYDAVHVLGHLLQSTFRAQFGRLLNVVRAHDHPGVCSLFWDLAMTKANAMGCSTLPPLFVKKHLPSNPKTGVYGQSSFVVMSLPRLLQVCPSRPDGFVCRGSYTEGEFKPWMRKCGIGFTANCLEAGPNARLKKALGMQLSLQAIHAIVQQSCEEQSKQFQAIGFSVRPDFCGKNPIYQIVKNYQPGEAVTGKFWTELWTSGTVKGKDPGFAERYMYGVKSLAKSWKGVDVTIATDFGINMAQKMIDYTEAKKGGKKGETQHHFLQKTRSNVYSNYKAWKAFVVDPEAYARTELQGYKRWTVRDARRQLADPLFLKQRKETDLLTPGDVLQLHERDLLFHQHSFVHVTANPNVLSPLDARLHLPEEWRFRMSVLLGHVMVDQPVDFGAYICHFCPQFAKYGFCEHCIIVGTMQREGA